MRRKSLTTLVAVLLLLTGCATTDQNNFDPATDDLGIAKPADLRELHHDAEWFTPPGEDATLDLTRDYAEAAFVYAIASDEVFDRSPNEYEPIPFPRSESWEPANADKEDLRTGFFARSWIRTDRHGKRDLVIVYRGTSGEWKDWYAGNLIIIPLPFEHQYKQALEYARDTMGKLKAAGAEYDDIVMTGHSLGGGLAQYVHRHVPDSRAVVFAPSPNTGWFQSFFYWNENNDAQALRTFERGEILQYLRWVGSFDFWGNDDPLAPGYNTRWIDTYDGKFLSGPADQHLHQDASMGFIKIAATVGNCEALDVIYQLERKRDPKYFEHPYYRLDCPSCTRKALRELSRTQAVEIEDVCQLDLKGIGNPQASN